MKNPVHKRKRQVNKMKDQQIIKKKKKKHTEKENKITITPKFSTKLKSLPFK